MRFLTVIAFTFFSLLALANPPASGAHSGVEWNNATPEQRQALDNFYRSLQASPNHNQLTERQQHLEQLRGMSSEQRQELFRNFVKQNQEQFR